MDRAKRRHRPSPLAAARAGPRDTHSGRMSLDVPFAHDDRRGVRLRTCGAELRVGAIGAGGRSDTRADPSDGLRRLERGRLQRQRIADRSRGEVPAQLGNGARWLPLRDHRRLLGGASADRSGRAAGRPREVPGGHRGGRRRRPPPGPQDRHLPGRRHDDVFGLPGKLRVRDPGRAHDRLLAHRF